MTPVGRGVYEEAWTVGGLHTVSAMQTNGHRLASVTVERAAHYQTAIDALWSLLDLIDPVPDARAKLALVQTRFTRRRRAP